MGIGGKENISPSPIKSQKRRKSSSVILSPENWNRIQSHNQKRRKSSSSLHPNENSDPSQFQFQSPNRRKSSQFLHPKDNHSDRGENKNRRKSSSSSRPEFDESFLEYLAKKCGLHLNPNEVLGRGSFGTVISGIYQSQSIAVKVINTNTTIRINSLEGEKIAEELPLHPNIIKIFDILEFGAMGGEDITLVLMERLRSGNLQSVINNTDAKFDMRTCLHISAQITSGLIFCHQIGVLHLDVKPQNILIDLSGQQCKLSDFGNAKRIRDLEKNESFLKVEGTVIYKAPELFRGFCPTEKCDIFSMGITMWQILHRECPYQGENEHSIIYKVVAKNLRPPILVTGDPQNDLCQICWDPDPESRPNARELLDRLNYFQLRIQVNPFRPSNVDLIPGPFC